VWRCYFQNIYPFRWIIKITIIVHAVPNISIEHTRRSTNFRYIQWISVVLRFERWRDKQFVLHLSKCEYFVSIKTDIKTRRPPEILLFYIFDKQRYFKPFIPNTSNIFHRRTEAC